VLAGVLLMIVAPVPLMRWWRGRRAGAAPASAEPERHAAPVVVRVPAARRRPQPAPDRPQEDLSESLRQLLEALPKASTPAAT